MGPPSPLPYDVARALAGAAPELFTEAAKLRRVCSGTDDDTPTGARLFVVRRDGWPWSVEHAPSGRDAEQAAAVRWAPEYGPADYHAIDVRAAPLPDLVTVLRRAREPDYRPEAGDAED